MDDDLFKSINFIKNVNLWPSKIFLPLKKKENNSVIFGVIFCKNLTTIKEANLFTLPITEKGFNALNGWTYNSVEEMVADGWEVD